EAAQPRPTISPTATPGRTPTVPGHVDLPRLLNGITLHAEVETTPGAAASDERADPLSYVLDLKLNARVPTPNRSTEEIAKVSPQLPRILPGLAEMVTPESVSPFFAQLY